MNGSGSFGYTLEQALAELQETRRLVATMTAELKTARSAVTQLSRCLDRAEVREQNLRKILVNRETELIDARRAF